MFSNRKKFWRSRWIIVVIVAFLGAGYWFSQNDKSPTDTNAPESNESIQKVDTQSGHSPERPGDNLTKGTKTEGSSQNDVGATGSFFLVKKVNDSIDIYFYKDEGEPNFVKSTDIEFSLLSNEDQKLFTEGIVLETENDLNELLQDFGS